MNSPDTIYTVHVDGNLCCAMSEQLLDVWFGSQTPEEKARIYEAALSVEEPELPFEVASLRSGLAAVVDGIDLHARRFGEAYRAPIACVLRTGQHVSLPAVRAELSAAIDKAGLRRMNENPALRAEVTELLNRDGVPALPGHAGILPAAPVDGPEGPR